MEHLVGEKLRLVDGAGRVLEPDVQLLAYVALVCQAEPGARVALPICTSRAAQSIARAAGGGVVWTPTSSSAVMKAAEEDDVAFAAAQDAGVIFPRFMPAFDAVLGLVKLLELLARTGQRLDRVIEQLPETHLVRRDVPTPWEAKGTVMRRVIEAAQAEGGDVMTIDGVKLFRGGDWALVVPHAEEPLVRVWAEAGSAADADALAEEFATMVSEAKS